MASGLFELLITLLEFIVSFVLLIFVFFIFIFYFSSFAEEKMKKVQSLILYLTYFILALTTMLPFSGFPWYVCILTTGTNLLWLYIQKSGFPFITLEFPPLVIAFICTIFDHFLLVLHFLHGDESFWLIVNYFIIFVWILPILILSSLCALDEDQVEKPEEKQQQQQTTEQKQTNKNVLGKFIGRMLKKAEESLPYSVNKDD